MASAKRIIIGNANTADDWIPYIGGTAYYAYIGDGSKAIKIPHWTAAPTQPATKFSSRISDRGKRERQRAGSSSDIKLQ